MSWQRSSDDRMGPIERGTGSRKAGRIEGGHCSRPELVDRLEARAATSQGQRSGQAVVLMSRCLPGDCLNSRARRGITVCGVTAWDLSALG
jgi:hypothetical protein